MEDFRNLYILNNVDGLGPVRIKRLLDKFDSAENVLKASKSELQKVDGLDEILSNSIQSTKKNLGVINQSYDVLIKKMDKLSIGVVCITDKNYPSLLKKIYDPPLILYYKGNYFDEDFQNKLHYCIGIVGTRNPSDYGKRAARELSSGLSDVGMMVVSGFARGIDTAAHKAVIEKNLINHKTIAVLGSGVDYIYPPENKKLYEQISERGLIFSECEVSAIPDAVNFPRRNRIISGLSLGVVVIESGKEGGALITARYALDQSREVFAVPGNIYSRFSNGTNNLIKNGQAKLVENIEDITVELQNRIAPLLGLKTSNKTISLEQELYGNEKLIFSVLTSNNESVNVDSISENTGLNISDCLVTLLNMEFKGLIKQLPGKRFSVSWN